MYTLFKQSWKFIMATFKSIEKDKEFIQLDSRRAATLANLNKLKLSLATLSTDKPSLRAFEKLSSKIDDAVDELESKSKAIACIFRKAGGDVMQDSDYIDYCKIEVSLGNELDVARDNYIAILETHGLWQKAPIPGNADLMATLKTMAEQSVQQAAAAKAQADATKAQTEAIKAHHKVPEMKQPTFDPAQCRNDPIAYANFFDRFEIFAEECSDDKARLGFFNDIC